MKRKVLIGLLSVIGCVAIAGSGFASWYFGVGDKSKEQNVSTHVTNLVTGSGELKDNNKDQNLYVVLNQGGYNNASDNTKGISIVDLSNSTSSTISDTNLGTEIDSLSVTYTISAEDATNLYNAKITSDDSTTATFTANIYLSVDAQKYLKFDSNYGSKVNDWDSKKCVVTDTGIIFNYEIEYKSNTAINKTFEFTTKTTDFVNSMLVYKSKPTTSTDYNAMKDTLNNQNILTASYGLYINER